MSTCDKLTGTLTLGATMSGGLLVAKGDKGDTGDKGDAYIITEADKQEIKEALSGDISELKSDLINLVDDINSDIIGCNLVNLRNIPSAVKSGVSFDVKDNGEIIANGTATSDNAFLRVSKFTVDESGFYTFSGAPNGSNGATYFTYLWNITTNTFISNIYDTYKTIFLEKDNEYVYNVKVEQRYTANNVIFKPMMTKGKEQYTFEPYSEIGDFKSKIYYLNNEISKLDNGIVKLKNDGDILSKIIFFDDFNGDKLSDVWTCEEGIVRNGDQESQYYRIENVSVDNSCLKLTARKESFGGRNFTSGSINSALGFMFGKNTEIEFKFRFENCNDGAWPAIWSFSPISYSDGKVWPETLEFDYFELWRSSDESRDYWTSSVHYLENGEHKEKGAHVGTYNELWHTMKIKWVEDYLYQYLDGVLINTFVANEITPMINEKSISHQLVINFAINSSRVTQNTNDEMAMYVDYVKVTRLSEQSFGFIQLSETDKSVNVGDEFYIYATADLDNPDKTIFWEIADDLVLTHFYKTRDYVALNSLGKFKALKRGTTTITVKDKRGTYAKCVVTVN